MKSNNAIKVGNEEQLPPYDSTRFFCSDVGRSESKRDDLGGSPVM